MRLVGDTRAHRETWLFIGLGLALLFGVFLRAYRLSSQRLWVDELYMLQLSRDDLSTLWRQAFSDILPPLASLPFWLSANLFGFTEAGIRAVSLIFALVALVLFWRVSRGVLESGAALAITWMFAISPLAIYYAQEARPYALGLASAVFTLWAYERLHHDNSLTNWVIYGLGACVAGQVYMLNVFLVGGQLLALLVLSQDRKRVLIGSATTVLVVFLLLSPFMFGANKVMETWHVRSPIAFLPPFMTMANGDLRIATNATRLVALGVLLIGWGLALFNRKTWKTLLPYFSQILFFVAGIFVFFPLLGKALPAYDERAYLMLLPASLLGFGLGIEDLIKIRARRILAIGLVSVFSLASFLSLWRYFNGFTKSPEGELAGRIEAEALPGDCAIVNRDAYSVDAALRFYSSLPVYYHNREDGKNWYLVPDYLLMIAPNDEFVLELGKLNNCNRFWIVQRSLPVSFISVFEPGYRESRAISVEPFLASLLSPK